MTIPTSPHGGNSQLQLALRYAAQGITVHPRNPRNKGPLTRHGHLDATTDRAQIIAWWTRWPHGLVAFPTGKLTGMFVLDCDGRSGRDWLAAILARLGLALPGDLTLYIVETPRGGLHCYFRLRPGERIKTLAGDIAADVDTRGEGGCIIAAGNRLPDGRCYRLIGPARCISEAAYAPRELVYLATFNKRERVEIVADPEVSAVIKDAATADWPAILEAHRRARGLRIAARTAPAPTDAMRRQALSDLHDEAAGYAALTDGRRNGLFSVASRLVRYVVNGVINEVELRSALREAAAANGALGTHGPAWLDGVIRRALAYGARDSLPPLARRFRKVA